MCHLYLIDFLLQNKVCALYGILHYVFILCINGFEQRYYYLKILIVKFKPNIYTCFFIMLNNILYFTEYQINTTFYTVKIF